MHYYKEETHEITPLTMAVLCERDEEGKIHSKVLEELRDYHVQKKPTKVVDYACKYFGSSLKGRLEGTKDISRITHKAPIAIDPSSGMFFFPTASPSNGNCSWISHSHVKIVKPFDSDRTELEFKNGRSIVLDVSYGSILNQIQRTAQFRYSLENRIKYIERTIIEKKNKNKDEDLNLKLNPEQLDFHPDFQQDQEQNPQQELTQDEDETNDETKEN